MIRENVRHCSNFLSWNLSYVCSITRQKCAETAFQMYIPRKEMFVVLFSYCFLPHKWPFQQVLMFWFLAYSTWAQLFEGPLALT